MPAYDVTVTATFQKTADQIAVETAQSLIEGGSYTVAQATANTEADVQAWLVVQINALSGMSATGITVMAADITMNNVTPAVAGTAGNLSGVNGGFGFTVSLAKGGSSVTTASTNGTITATQQLDFTAYVRVKWNMVMMMNLLQLHIEGYNPLACRWYRGVELVGMDFTYSKRTGRIETDRFFAGDIYHFEIETPKGVVRSTDYTIPAQTSSVSATLLAYPNPARAGEPVYLSLGVEEESDDRTDEMLREAGVSLSDFPTESLENALIRVYSSDGTLILQQRAEGDRTELRLPKAGLYIIRVNEQTTKVVISE
jgi:hypothetical protein